MTYRKSTLGRPSTMHLPLRLEARHLRHCLTMSHMGPARVHPTSASHPALGRLIIVRAQATHCGRWHGSQARLLAAQIVLVHSPRNSMSSRKRQRHQPRLCTHIPVRLPVIRSPPCETTLQPRPCTNGAPVMICCALERAIRGLIRPTC